MGYPPVYWRAPRLPKLMLESKISQTDVGQEVWEKFAEMIDPKEKEETVKVAKVPLAITTGLIIE